MVDATLKKNMITLLRDLKYSKFISYDCGKTFNTAYGNLRINTDKGSIEITNLVKTIPFFDIEEDAACFECKEANSSEEFKPYCIESFKNFEVGEKITGIEIINDLIRVAEEEYEISFDQAIIIRTENKIIMFSRDIWFSEVITISDNDDYDSIFPISEVIDSWSNFGEYNVNVTRTKHML